MKRLALAVALFLALGCPVEAYVNTSCTVGLSSAQCLAAGSYGHVMIENNSANTIACAWGQNAVLNSGTSIQLGPGGSALWGPSTGGVPSNALNCISSVAGSALYIEN